MLVEFDAVISNTVESNLMSCPKGMTYHQHIGYIYEVTVALAFHKAGFQKILTNPFEEVQDWMWHEGYGVDIVLPDEDIIVEIKNNSGSYFMTPYMIEEHTLERFEKTDPDHSKSWLVVYAHDKMSLRAEMLLEQNRVTVVSSGLSATSDNMENVVEILVPEFRKLHSSKVFTAIEMKQTIDEDIIAEVFAVDDDLVEESIVLDTVVADAAVDEAVIADEYFSEPLASAFSVAEASEKTTTLESSFRKGGT